MLTINLKEIKDAYQSIFDTGIAAFIESKMAYPYARLRSVATVKIRRKAHELPDSHYVLTVDGKEAIDLTAIQRAKKRVWAQWLDPLVDMAFGVMVDELKAAIKESESSMTKGFLLNDSLTNYITVYHHCSDGRPSSVRRGTAQGIEFRPGDTVMLIPDLVTALYSNVQAEAGKDKGGKVSKYSSRPFMKKAVDKIRRKAKVKKLVSPIRIFAGRSRSAYNYVAKASAKRKDGSEIVPLPRNAAPWMRSAWAIIITYQSPKFRRA